MFTGGNFISPSSVTETVSDGTTGDHTYVAALKDGNLYQVEELNGNNPGYDIEFNFTNVRAVYGLSVVFFYSGGAGHDASINLYNYNTTTFDELIFYTDTSDHFQARYIEFPNNGNYVDGSGNARMRFIQDVNGLGQHFLQFDYIALIGRKSA